ncbi:MAG: hypothetical protein N2689_02750 [Verrucomicrobiae bacterium]|nr:hypothetical protein [Verrucomicrobiae bacterium]
MKLSHYLAFILAAALLVGCSSKEASKPEQPPKGPAVTGTTTVTPAPPPPVQPAKEPVQLFPPPTTTNATPIKTTEPAPSAKPAPSIAPAVTAKPAEPAKPAETKKPGTVTAPGEVKPAARPPGQPLAKVVMVKADEKWLILQFPTNEIPAPGSHLTLYRGKDRVGTIKVTEPMDIPNLRVTADILDGKPERGDEVR